MELDLKTFVERKNLNFSDLLFVLEVLKHQKLAEFVPELQEQLEKVDVFLERIFIYTHFNFQ